MSAPMFSSGPWMAHGPSKPLPDEPEGGNWCVMDGGTNILAEAFFCVGEGVGGTRPAMANALLIAASPDLYDALSALVARYEHDGIPNDSAATVDAARVALAKARGEA